jgi:hypothetical protein
LILPQIISLIMKRFKYAAFFVEDRFLMWFFLGIALLLYGLASMREGDDDKEDVPTDCWGAVKILILTRNPKEGMSYHTLPRCALTCG